MQLEAKLNLINGKLRKFIFSWLSHKQQKHLWRENIPLNVLKVLLTMKTIVIYANLEIWAFSPRRCDSDVRSKCTSSRPLCIFSVGVFSSFLMHNSLCTTQFLFFSKHEAYCEEGILKSKLETLNIGRRFFFVFSTLNSLDVRTVRVSRKVLKNLNHTLHQGQ